MIPSEVKARATAIERLSHRVIALCRLLDGPPEIDLQIRLAGNDPSPICIPRESVRPVLEDAVRRLEEEREKAEADLREYILEDTGGAS